MGWNIKGEYDDRAERRRKSEIIEGEGRGKVRWKGTVRTYCCGDGASGGVPSVAGAIGPSS